MDKNPVKNNIEIFELLSDSFYKKIEHLIIKAPNNDEKLKEVLIFFESAFSSIIVARDLHERSDFINSFSLLRSSFESMICGLAIYSDKETYEHFKYVNFSSYKIALEKKYEREKKKNPKYSVPNINKKSYLMTPEKLRETVSKNHQNLFFELFDNKDSNEVKSELDKFYWFLCDFVHPTLIKSYLYKIQNENEIDNIKHIMRINIFFCSLLLLLGVASILKEKNTNVYFDLYSLLFLFNFYAVNKTDTTKKILDKYKKYLYFELNSDYIKNRTNELSKLKDEFEDLKKTDIDKEQMNIKLKNIFIEFEIEWSD